MIALSFFALIGLAAAAYAHITAARYIATPGSVWTTHAVLLIVAFAFGYVLSIAVDEDGALRWLAFLAGFGAVHIPPAIVLMIKRARHSPKS